VTPTRCAGRGRWVTGGAVAFLGVSAALTTALWSAGDRWWPATLLMFGPRWWLAVPAVAGLAVAAAARSRAATAAAAVALVVVLVPFTGLTVAGPLGAAGRGLQGLVRPEPPAGYRLRVVSWNMAARRPGPEFARFLQETDPAVVVCQEADVTAADFPAGWGVVRVSSNCVASPLPTRLASSLNFYDLGVGGRLDRFVVETPPGDLDLIDVHLPTVRPGLEVALGTKFRDVSELRRVIGLRVLASSRARAWVGPGRRGVIAAGDFNTPVESRLFRDDWADFGNAFSTEGVGWGTTKQTSWFGVRIDHVLFTPPWVCRGAWVGPAMGSDHRPVVADFTHEGGAP